MKCLALFFITSLLVSITCSHKRTLSLNKYLNRFKWSVQKTSTRDNDFGNEATIYLDRHAPNCDIGAISQFHLQRAQSSGRWNRIRYDTWCIMPAGCNKRCPNTIRQIDRRYCQYKNTPPNDLGSWTGRSTNYLDRHYVKCPANTVLTSFQLVSNWRSHKINYRYRCCPAKVSNCRSYNTANQAYGDMGNIYLDRQWVKTPNINTQAITGFRLLANYSSRTFHYQVDYCTVVGR